MKKIILGLASILSIFLLVSNANAQKPVFEQYPVIPLSGNATVSIPEQAAEVMPGVFDLGLSTDELGRKVQGYAIVRYKEGHKKPDWAGGGNGGGNTSDTSSCYAFLAKDAKWKVEEPWIINTSNVDGLSSSFVFNNMAANIDKWESAAANANILGSGSTTNAVLVANYSSPDGQNEVYFADIPEANVIGVTVVWGIFYGPPHGRELVEWDQIYDDTDFDWTEDALLEPNKMDFEAIATHELGHTFGLADLYDSGCSTMTMYGYGSEGDTYQRDLGDGDINGVSKLY